MPVNNQSQPQVTPEQPKRQGSGFTNLSRILQANRNNRLGQSIQSGIVGGSEQVRQQLGDTRNQFQQASDAGNLASDQNKQIRENVLKGIASGQSDLAAPQVQQFEQFRGGQYGGPKEMDQAKVAALSAKAQELQNQGKNPLAETTLQATVGAQSRNPYTRGQIGLDRTLLGTLDPSVLGQTRAAVRGLPQNVARQQEAARQLAQQRTGEAAKFGQETSKQLGEQTGGLQSNIAQNVEAAKAARDKLLGQYQTGFQSGDISNLAGIDRYLGQLQNKSFYNLNPSEFLYKGPEASKENVTTQQQKAQLDALAKLSGTTQDYVPKLASEQFDPTKNVQFDIDRFLNTQQETGRQYQNALNAPEVQASLTGFNPFGAAGQNNTFNSNMNIADARNRSQNYIDWATRNYLNRPQAAPGEYVNPNLQAQQEGEQKMAQSQIAQLQNIIDQANQREQQINQQYQPGRIFK